MLKNTLLVCIVATFTQFATGAISIATAGEKEPTFRTTSPSSDATQSEASEAATYTKAYDPRFYPIKSG